MEVIRKPKHPWSMSQVKYHTITNISALFQCFFQVDMLLRRQAMLKQLCVRQR